VNDLPAQVLFTSIVAHINCNYIFFIRYCKLQHDWSVGHASMTTWLYFCITCISYVFRMYHISAHGFVKSHATVPRCGWCWVMVSAAISFDYSVDCSKYSALHDWWLSRACCSSSRWNSLPQLVTSSPSNTDIQWHLKTKCLLSHTTFLDSQ